LPDAAHGDPAARAAGRRRRLDLHLLAHARRLHHADTDRRRLESVHRQRRLRRRQPVEQPALRRRVRGCARRRDGRLPRDRAAARRLRRPLMETRGTRVALGAWVALVLAFLYVPIAVICLYACNKWNVQSWPIAGLTTRWFGPAIHNGDMQQALWLSLRAADLATAIGL